MQIEGEIVRKDARKMQAFGWAYVVSEDGGQTQVVDKSGERILIDELNHLEDAAYDFVVKSRVGADWHVRKGVSTMIESMVFTPEKKAAMGLPDSFPLGWWVGFQFSDKKSWDMIEKGLYTMFSVHGKSVKKEV